MTINLEKIRIMSKANFENLQELQDDELYFVEFTDYIKNIIKSALTLSLSGRSNMNITEANRTYTVPFQGTILGSISVSDNSSPVINITRNNVVYTVHKFQGASNEVNTDDINIPVLQGDIFTVSGGKIDNGNTLMYFYPLNIEV